jgi:hypothetical protein
MRIILSLIVVGFIAACGVDGAPITPGSAQDTSQ